MICLGIINMSPVLFMAQISAQSGNADPKSAMEKSFAFGSSKPTLFRCASLTSTTAKSEEDDVMEQSVTVIVVALSEAGLNHLRGFNFVKVSRLCSLAELIGSLKLGNVRVFVQLIHRPTRNKNQMYKIPNIA